MKEDKQLKQQLNRPQVPEDLQDRIRTNWKQQLSHAQKKWPGFRFVIAASVFGLGIAVILVNISLTAPKLVTAAVNDIKSDRKLEVGIAVPIETLVEAKNINLPPKSMPIRMTKYCSIDGNQTVHLKVAGEKQGEVHLFIRSDDFSGADLGSEEGVIDSMPWRLINPRKGLSVLVLHTPDMNPANVEKLIQTMFYA